MADRVKKASYCYPIVPNRAGQGARILAELAHAGIDLLAYSGFPAGAGGRSSTSWSRTLARCDGWPGRTDGG